MKPFIENNTELIKLAQFFRKIEVIAEKSGIDIDDLIEDQINKNYFFFLAFQDSKLSFAKTQTETYMCRASEDIL